MCADCGWRDFLERCERLEDDERFRWAHDTVFGIAEWVEENEHVTERQRGAIANIEEAGRR